MNDFTFFKKTREIDSKITEFFNNVSEGGLLFQRAVALYLDQGANEDFSQKLKQVSAFETRNDQLRRDVESQLYEHTLLPDSRADVLELLEGVDRVINKYESSLYMYSIEKPVIPENYHIGFKELTQTVIDCTEALVASSRSFFAMNGEIENTLHKVMFFEKQADLQGTDLKRQIFDNPGLELAHKLQLKSFEAAIEDISDIAEDVADTLTVISVKRSF